MNKIWLLMFCLSLYSGVNAQTHVVIIDFQKNSREALENEMGYSQNSVIGAIDESMAKLGYKGKADKEFVVYRGVALPELGGGAYDLYYTVDKKSGKDHEFSLIRMMISKGDKNFITSSSDPGIMGKAKTYLDSLQNMVSVYDYEQKVLAQAEMVKKQEKKLKNLLEESTDLEKKRRKVEEQITENNRAQQSQQQELENQRKILETMKGTRKE